MASSRHGRPVLAALLGAVGALSCNQIFGISGGDPTGTGGHVGGTTSTTVSTSSSSGASSTSSSSSGTGGGPAVSLQGCVLLLHFDETSWSGAGAVKDSSGQHNDGTALGTATPTSGGKLGGAALLDGGGSILVSHSASLDGPFTALTYSAWIYPTGLGTPDPSQNAPFPGIIAKRENYGSKVELTLFVWSSNQLWADVGDDGADRISSQAVIANGAWVHVAVVYDASLPAAQRTTFYVNGTPEPAQQGPTSIGSQTSDLSIGVLPLGSPQSGGFWQGKIDEVAVWNRALSAAEMKALSQATTEL